ncbi:binding-protein-dependent transport systems inner membrane component [Ruminiclostridium papyrosolvens DSM 2782]|uniref:Binding-protein-dependent transport systems inner membrane component n=1 Tax=Ruminiclostridium papyrosolvens DSM 2782 TaxID=588581 RepID=F1T994_9FIRM|nr:sugar ABC transporter permease [Ruminiclostridium papyrosolvens]EGD49076.1 binding-protein-dependent transport systems inner membrane component [Ruminiclostridium papyrosolvens DSM 2782]WES35556.1 sugar ABC transporter permease [Ruminiclostridium papyrosolvens DSM 2782]
MNNVLSNKKYIAIFVLPAFIFYTVFVLFPIGYNVYLSFFRTNLMGNSTFIGITNYINLINDQFFVMAFKNNIFLMIGSLLAHLPLALFFANALFQKIKGSKIFQYVFFLPTVICGVAVGMMFNFVYNSEFGIVNKILDIINLGNLKMGWLNNEKTVMYALIFVIMWRFVGYHMVIQLAAMKSIPESLYESASLEGATRWQQFRNITFPLIRNILKIDTILIITGSIKYYDLVAVMTKGGPNHASEVMSTYMFYQGFRTMKFGYASAIGIILLILCLLVIMGVNYFAKTEDYEY